jgi:hypothetical protein
METNKSDVVIPRGDGVLESTMYYDMDGKPYTGKTMDEITMKWCKDFEAIKARKVGDTRLMFGLVHISTVWLGLNHSWGGGKPQTFETMIFVGGWGEYYCCRYSTKDEALRGHEDAVLNAYRIILLDKYNCKRLIEEGSSWIIRKSVQRWTELLKFLESRLTRNTK